MSSFHEMNVLRTATLVSASLSVLASAFVIGIFLMHRNIRVFSVRILVYTSICDFVASSSYFLPSSPLGCAVQARLHQLFGMASLLWVLCFYINMYMTVVLKRGAVYKYGAVFGVLAWCMPLILALMVEWMGAYGLADEWCWIKSTHMIVRWTLYYIPQTIIIACIAVFMYSIRRALHTAHMIESRARPYQRFTAGAMARMELTAYFIVFVCLHLPGFNHRWSQLHHGADNQSFAHRLFHCTCAPLIGLVNALLFISRGFVRAYIRSNNSSNHHIATAAAASMKAISSVGQHHHHQNNSHDDDDDGNDDDDGDSALLTPTALQHEHGSSYMSPFPPWIIPHDICNIFVGTWNLGKQPPPNVATLQQWIPNDSYDVYAIGAQEVTYESGDHRPWMQHWQDTVSAAVGSEHCVVATCHLGAIHLVVLARRSLLPVINDVDVVREPCGIGNIGHNKGGVAVALRVGRLSLCFLNVHLAAFHGNIHKRNGNIVQIMRRLQFKHVRHYHEFHALFLFGDLNYRMRMTRSEVLQAAATENWDVLAAHDELTGLRDDGVLYDGFNEGRLMHPPTYKYIPNTNSYAERIPAWCDRVLWTNRRKVHVQHTFYGSIHGVCSSDHKPVKCCFRVGFRGLASQPTTPLPYRHHRKYGNNVAATATVLSSYSGDDDDDDDDDGCVVVMNDGGDKYANVCIQLCDVKCFGCTGPMGLPLTDPYMVVTSRIIDIGHPNGVHIYDGMRVDDYGTHVWEHTIPAIPIDNAWEANEAICNYCVVIELHDAVLIDDDSLVGTCIVELSADKLLDMCAFQAPLRHHLAHNGFISGTIGVNSLYY